MKFALGMPHVSDVNRNLEDAKELRESLWEAALETRKEDGALDVSAKITIPVTFAVDAVKALDLLTDMLLSKELK